MKKKPLSYATMLALLLSLAGCASDQPVSSTTTTTEETSSVQPVTTTTEHTTVQQ